MAIIRFQATWHPEYQENAKAKGYLVLKPAEDYVDKLRRELMRLKDRQEKSGEKVLDVTIDIHYRKRSLDANALMWATYQIEANEQNGGKIGPGAVTSEELYEQDLEAYAPRITMRVPSEQADMVKRFYRKIESVEPDSEDPWTWIITAIVTSSHFDTKQMSRWIDMRFDRLAEWNITEPADIEYYWKEYQKWKNRQSISSIDPAADISGAEYKRLTTRCEACGIPFKGEARGSLAHIKARGMGGNPEEYKDKPGNWLHLCDPDHALYDNGEGASKFARKYPHLRGKIESALKHSLQ